MCMWNRHFTPAHSLIVRKMICEIAFQQECVSCVCVSPPQAVTVPCHPLSHPRNRIRGCCHMPPHRLNTNKYPQNSHRSSLSACPELAASAGGESEVWGFLLLFSPRKCQILPQFEAGRGSENKCCVWCEIFFSRRGNPRAAGKGGLGARLL